MKTPSSSWKFFNSSGGDLIKWILCECGEFVENNRFRDYIETSIGPSTPTFGHSNCGLLFDFIDIGMPKRFSSKKELKVIATKFASKCHMSSEVASVFLLKVDLFKSEGIFSDAEILKRAFRAMSPELEIE